MLENNRRMREDVEIVNIIRVINIKAMVDVCYSALYGEDESGNI